MQSTALDFQSGGLYPRLQLEGSNDLENDLDEFPLIGLETCFSAVYHQRKKKAWRRVHLQWFQFHVGMCTLVLVVIWCDVGLFSVGSVYAYTANMATRLFVLVCVSVLAFMRTAPPASSQRCRTGQFGSPKWLFGSVGFGVGGWGVVVGVALRSPVFSPRSSFLTRRC